MIPTRSFQVLCVIFVLIAAALPLNANGERAFFECPCSLEFDGEEAFTLTAGFRNFSNVDLENMHVQVTLQTKRWFYGYNALLATIDIDQLLPTGGDLIDGTFEQSAKYEVSEDGEHYVLLRLVDKDGSWHDSIFMKEKVDASSEFTIYFLDYLADSDDDGVSDLNEEIEGTDANDPASVPPDTVIDVVALYGASFADEFDGDATTRIQHVFELANQFLTDSDLSFQWRIVGTVEVEMDDQTTSLDDTSDLVTEGERHGSDLAVLFGPFPDKGGYCGFAGIYGWGRRGDLSEVDLTYALATVVGTCGARTLAHELGHLMGLHHSVWQNSIGAWRWSRGHGVNNQFYTIMSYGQGGSAENVFSDPDSECGSDDASCGEAHHKDIAADSVATLNAVRFQYARARESFPDSDGDGFVDPVDVFPEDASEWIDSDGDGIGNNADEDDDNDGYLDDDDAFPFDPSEHSDTDEDGVGDNSDAFPNDPTEWSDSDGDGVGDNSDVFPLDSSEWVDSDGDGTGDNSDAFPEDPTEWLDSDNDGVGNNADTDDDGDSVLDIDDAYPLDENLTEFFSYKFVLESESDSATSVIGFGDSQDDSVDTHVLIGVPELLDDEANNAGGAYLVSIDELAQLDEADGVVDHVVSLSSVMDSSKSWKFLGRDQSFAGDSVNVGDIDGDDRPDLVVGVPYENHGGNRSGSLYIIPFEHLDEIDTDQNRVVSLSTSDLGEFGWRIDGRTGDQMGSGDRVSVGDVDADGYDDILAGTHALHTEGHDGFQRAAYFIPGSKLQSMDEADGAHDRVIDVFGAVGSEDSRLFLSNSILSGRHASVDLDLALGIDRQADLMIGTGYSGDSFKGSVYLLAGSQITAADNADGEEDGRIDLDYVSDQQDSWLIQGSLWGFFGRHVEFLHDFSDDGMADYGVAGIQESYFVASQDLETLDANDGNVDGKVSLGRWFDTGNSLVVFSMHPIGSMSSGHHMIASSSASIPAVQQLNGVYQMSTGDLQAVVSQARNGFEDLLRADSQFRRTAQQLRSPRPFIRLGADIEHTTTIDGDEIEDLLATAIGDSRDESSISSVYLISSRDLVELENRNDENRILFVEDMWGDNDEDGVKNFSDPDDDNDYIYDVDDVFPFDDSEWVDSDGDGFGDNIDAFPSNNNEYLDTDGDGLGDNNQDSDDDNDGILDVDDEYPLDTDNDGIDNVTDSDDDGDGVLDEDDAFPIDPNESLDWDGDGVGDNADGDDDNDGVEDDADAFPFDSSESTDTDEDGVGDNSDAFPNDPEEWVDTDGDGTGNNADTDDDGDGVLDVDDSFPLDPTKSSDSDGDGVADDDDAFPNDSSEWNDLDGDGIGDNSDPDRDNDGVVNEEDEFPRDKTRVDLRSVMFVPWNVGSDIGSEAGGSGDSDGDDLHDILLSGQAIDESYEIYLVSSATLNSADATDGMLDGIVNAGHITELDNSWRIDVPEADDEGVVQLLRVGEISDQQSDSFLVSTSAGLISDAYVIAPSDVELLDEEDGATDGVVKLEELIAYENTWIFVGGWNQRLGRSATFVADIDRDGKPDICIGAPGVGAGELPGSVYIVSSAALEAVDNLDGLDGRIRLSNAVNNHSSLNESERVWSFTGKNPYDLAGTAVASGDFDHDGLSDIVIGAPAHDSNDTDDGAVYLVGSSDWENIDEADNNSDRSIDLELVAEQPSSWKFIGDGPRKRLGSSVEVADLNQDRTLDLIVMQQGTVVVLSETDFGYLDETDGTEDGTVVVRGLSDTQQSWRISCPTNWLACNIAIVDGPASAIGRSIVIGKSSRSSETTVAYMVSADDFASLDELDGNKDRILDLSHVDELPNSFRFESRKFRSLPTETAFADLGDFDGDDRSDLLMTIRDSTWNSSIPSETYVISSAELNYLDEMDGSADGAISLERITSRVRKANELDD